MRSSLWALVFSLCACASGASTDVPRGLDGGGTDASVDAPVALPDANGDVQNADADAPIACRPVGDCSPFVATDCAAGASCRRNDDDTAWICRPIAATRGGEGAPCSSGDACAAGLLCVGASPNARCVKLCPEGSVGFCGGENRCTGDLGDPCVRTCRARPAACDIYAQDCTAEGRACAFASDGETGEPYTACLTAGPRTSGEACGGDAGECARGLVCIRSDAGTSACRKVCRPEGGSPACDVGETCSGFAAPWNTGYCKPTFD